MSLQPLARLRLDLTAWYLATFGAILVFLGAGLFVVIGRQFARQLDDSLRDATIELERAARIREMESKTARRQLCCSSSPAGGFSCANRPLRSSARSSRCGASWPTRRTSFARPSPSSAA